MSLLNSSYFLLENDEDNAGKNTVLNATPKTPAGNSINRSAKYNQDTLPC